MEKIRTLEEINDTVNINIILLVSIIKGAEITAELICVRFHSNIIDWLNWDVINAETRNTIDNIAIT